jgi:hypothetical protein
MSGHRSNRNALLDRRLDAQLEVGRPCDDDELIADGALVVLRARKCRCHPL